MFSPTQHPHRAAQRVVQESASEPAARPSHPFCFRRPHACAARRLFLSQPVEPAEEDRRFAAFYSDYLLASGVSGRSQGAPAVAALDSAALGALLEKHGLDVGALQERTEAYRQDPELWQQVLMQVREEIKLKNRSGK